LTRWQSEGDPLRVMATAIRRFKPDLLLTFDPHHGATGHPEHQLTARLAGAALRLAADPDIELGGLAPHRVERTYQLVNRYWPLVLVGLSDPPPVTEQFDTTLPCGQRTCLEVMLTAIREHRTQYRDMQKVAAHRGAFEVLNLRQVDPYTQGWDPAEPAERPYGRSAGGWSSETEPVRVTLAE
jgi:LmbE family N-acetylglucosaminyl deacetylase